MQHYYALILAGGGGTRLWPMSRKASPKQMLPLIEDDTLFQASVRRLAPLFSPEQIYIVTGQDYVEALRAQTPEIPKENFIVEPSARDNAAAAGLAITVIQKRDPKATIAMLTSDHHIAKKDHFRDVLTAARHVAGNDYIVTLGISPTYPSTGFGYIEQGEKLGNQVGFAYHKAERFTEKPDPVRATQFVASGRYSWNSGMFIWKASTAMREFERQQPAMFALFHDLQSTVDTSQFDSKLKEVWENLTKISIDFAIMEGAEKMAVIPVDIGWSDVGTWDALYDVIPQDRFGNCTHGASPKEHVVLDTRNTLVFSDRMTVTIGIEDIVLIDTEDAILICHKDRAQDVKQVVQYLKDNGYEDYL
ncbi:mannose-1-phosphate guanylyltransferase [Phototrophicus methaneseepsis]|uniref:mannose-1-phosphate guanylyltransferase n=1 Tax=Phototrophicus methaneseepsis TaxID=2710758 RepID=A0A7S8ICU5_9CHLR|nr:mannose-1-phosphate guanylyltransferase [Phototrophicus methaneseepsis]QPC80851.1 mannose-1-phosphate guanylyltransferase [Phototrophicus methaneseepsis]